MVFSNVGEAKRDYCISERVSKKYSQRLWFKLQKSILVTLFLAINLSFCFEKFHLAQGREIDQLAVSFSLHLPLVWSGVVVALSIDGIGQERMILSVSSDRLSIHPAIGQSVSRITRSRIDSWS